MDHREAQGSGPAVVSSGHLAALSRAVRESTVKRLRKVPPGLEGWRPAPGMMSFGDIAQHLLDGDAWLAAVLRERDMRRVTVNAQGACGLAPGGDSASLPALIGQLEVSRAGREALVGGLCQQALVEQVADEDGNLSDVWWLILRRALDHETHHRGQLGVYLRLAHPG